MWMHGATGVSPLAISFLPRSWHTYTHELQHCIHSSIVERNRLVCVKRNTFIPVYKAPILALPPVRPLLVLR